MLVITIDILPGGDPRRRKTIASMTIGNISNLADISDYVVQGFEEVDTLSGSQLRAARTFVRGHDRRQHVWPLIAKAADALAEAEFAED
jgi:hypothetical protein